MEHALLTLYRAHCIWLIFKTNQILVLKIIKSMQILFYHQLYNSQF